MPDFSLRLNDGRLVESDALNGRVSVLVFFTVGCSDCRQQLPVVDALYKIYRDDPQVTIFAVSRAVPEWEIAPYWKENSFSLPYSAQETRSVYELFASSIVPRIYLSNKHRVVCEVFTDAPLADLQTLTDSVHRLLTEE
ncbi:MAG: TlpA family protein disulfide reductase [Bacteroidia bacterium]|nr:TlpA family protein disulfide reductase [Bacteroidia bacterium]